MTPAFTHDVAGTSASVWRDDPRFASVEPVPQSWLAHDRLVVVAAHPDDETLGAAGLTAQAARAGLEVTLLLVTAGERSHPHSPTVTASQLARLRSAESAVALAAVAPAARTQHLGVGDGEVADREPWITSRLVELVGDGRHTLLVGPWRRDGHPDHEAAGRACAAAALRTGAALLEYPVWWWHWAGPDDAPWGQLRLLALDHADVDLKVEALASHRTQVQPLSDAPGDETMLSASFLEHFTGKTEVFVVENPHDPVLDDLHGDVAQPWGADRRWYERRKRDLMLAVLPRERFEHAVELGCSTGELAAAVARRCDRLLALDDSPTAVARARTRLADQGHVSVGTLRVPEDWPEGDFDLIVVSELGYFLSPVSLEVLAGRIADSLTPDGVVLLGHWRHEVAGWVLDGPEVHRRMTELLGLQTLASYVDRDVEILLLGTARAMPEPSA